MQLSLAQIDGLLSESRATIGRLTARASYVGCDPRLRDQVAGMAVKQAKLEYMRSKVGYTPAGNLGIIGMLIGSGIAALSALGLWAWKQYEETNAVEEQAGLVDELIKQGYTKEEVLAIMAGRGSMLDDVMSKLVILAALVGGIIVFMKLK